MESDLFFTTVSEVECHTVAEENLNGIDEVNYEYFLCVCFFEHDVVIWEGMLWATDGDLKSRRLG